MFSLKNNLPFPLKLVGGLAIVLFLSGLIWLLVPGDGNNKWGKFSGSPAVTLLDNGRDLRLEKDFFYTDPRGKLWVAEKASEVNGASIPRSFWTIVGGPLEGKYRNASIIHDVACVKMAEPWEAVHMAFYEACRCGGTGEKHAKILYAAVYHAGPRWKLRAVQAVSASEGPDGKVINKTTTRYVPERIATDDAFNDTATERKLKEKLSTENLTLEQIRDIDLKSL